MTHSPSDHAQDPLPADDTRQTLDALFGGSNAPLTRRERSAVLARIHALMEYWGITVDELAADGPAAAPAPVAAPVIKYRHPETGETWDGQGAHPEWLRRALLKEGLRVDELRPSSQAPSQA